MKRALVLFIFALRAFAALSATGVWEIRPTNGVDTNGGGFDPGVASPGTDFSQQGAAQISFTDLVIGSTTTQFTSALNPVDATFPGNFINITGGTGCTAGWYEILSNSTVTATVDRSMGTAASICTAKLGGALKTLTKLNTLIVAGNQAWVKAEATIGTTVSFLFNFSGSGTLATPIVGYMTTRGDGGSVTLQESAQIAFNAAIVDLEVQGASISNFVLDCNSRTGSQALHIQGSASIQAQNILVTGCLGSAAISFNNQYHSCIRCIVTGSVVAFSMDGNNGPNFCYYCAALGNTGIGFSMSYGGCYRCISANNTGAGSYGFSIGNSCCAPVYLISSIAYGNGGDGLRIGGAPTGLPIIENNAFYGNGGYGIDLTSGAIAANAYVFDYNAFGANSSGARHNVAAGTGDVALTADPFTNGPSNTFTLNATAGGGAALKAVGYPGVFSIGGTTVGTGGLDIGALQSVVSGGGSGSNLASWSPLLPE